MSKTKQETAKKIQNITLLGCGAMGQRMALRLIDAGFALSVYNRDSKRVSTICEAGARRVDAPASAVQDADLVINMLTDDPACQAVWFDGSTGAMQGLRKGTVVVQSSTLSLAYVKKLGEQIETSGADYIDAPVVGSRPQAESGSLLFLTAGKAHTIEKASAVLQILGKLSANLGAIGNATLMKHAINAYFGIQVAAIAEIVGMLHKSEIPRQQSIDLLSGLPITSPALQFVLAQIEQQAYAPLFPIDLVAKDFAYILKTAQDYAVDLPTTSRVSEVFRQAATAGYGGENISAVARLFVRDYK
ncbi:MAG: NAD(P)-dependent oxidoreductase [Thiohalomonadales bacterium]